MSAARILALEESGSTNDEARWRAEAGERGPLWITAKRQTAGRGRRGRLWETGKGNLAATHLFITERAPGEAAQVSFVAALAVADLASIYVDASLVRLKWPNDTLIAGRKTAGILVESGAAPASGLWLAVGMGVNLATPPSGTDRPATAFSEHMAAPPPPPLEALQHLDGRFSHWRRIWDRQGFSPIAEAWTARAHGLGARCRVCLAQQTLEGVAEGLDADGALRLRTDAGDVLRITAGDVFF